MSNVVWTNAKPFVNCPFKALYRKIGVTVRVPNAVLMARGYSVTDVELEHPEIWNTSTYGWPLKDGEVLEENVLKKCRIVAEKCKVLIDELMEHRNRMLD